MSEKRMVCVDEAKSTLMHDYAYAAAELLDEVPTIDPETLPIVRELRAQLEECKPVVHAHWIDRDHGYQMCSKCGEEVVEDSSLPFRVFGYCPHCGAIMDEEIQ